MILDSETYLASILGFRFFIKLETMVRQEKRLLFHRWGIFEVLEFTQFSASVLNSDSSVLLIV